MPDPTPPSSETGTPSSGDLQRSTEFTGEEVGPAHEVLDAALAWLGEGRGVALATVVRTWGSSPRPVGSQCAMTDQLDFEGSVSGGCVEAAVLDAGQGVIGSGEPRLLEFDVADEEAWSVGLACGGKMRIWLEAVQAGGSAGSAAEGGASALPAEILARVRDEVAEGRAPVLATNLGTEHGGQRHTLLFPLEDGGATGDEATPSSGASALGEAVLEAAREAVRADRSTIVEGPDGPLFLRVYNPPRRLVIVGAVHIAQYLTVMAATAGFDPIVVDPRVAFGNDRRFPSAHTVNAWPEQALADLKLDHRTAVVLLSHDPKLDDPALRAALPSPAFYVGALGSRRTHAKRVERLREAGLDEETIARIEAPVGLDIGASTPAEIAVAIIAQVVERIRNPRAAA